MSENFADLPPKMRVKTALSSKRIVEMIALLYVDEKGMLDLNDVFNAVVNGICQISVKCSTSPEAHEELINQVIRAMETLCNQQVSDWEITKGTVEQSAAISYAHMIHLSHDYVNVQN